ncbi:cytidine deaminase-like protein [Paraphysoderma sedebokerense]|nr:cytidine deaminase-like protein [Paraphysoderma sedebokerense]
MDTQPESPSQSQIERLIHNAFEAKNFSYSPYSKFRVGAALLTKSGKYFTGCNVENASYGGCICAERTAYVKAVSEGHKDMFAICVSTDIDYATPCGFCRQFMVEFGKETTVILTNSKREYKMMKLKELLPLSFGPEDLSKPRDGQRS